MYEDANNNNERLIAVDFIKSIAIIFMMLIHSFEVFAKVNVHSSGFINFMICLLGSPFVAPVFMFSMGVGLIYTKKKSSLDFFKKGLFLFFIGYALQIFRDLPRLILGIQTNSTKLINESLHDMVGVDIMIFAGIFFILFSLLKKQNTLML